MKCNLTSRPLTPDLSQWPVGSPERFIHGCWQLNMKLFHTFLSECGSDIQDVYRRINFEVGAQTAYLDLHCLEEDYRNKSQIMEIVRDNEQPIWLWISSCDVLLDTSIAGWLRSVLTTYYTEHIRVVFLLDSQQQYRDIFRTCEAPLYDSTVVLELYKT